MASFSFFLVPAAAPTTTSVATRARVDTETDATDWGWDLTTWAGSDQELPDLDPSFGAITGQRVVSEAIARRLCTPRGSLPDDRAAGFDLRRLVHSKLDTTRQLQLKTAIESEAEKDERVYRARTNLEIEYGRAGTSRQSVFVTAAIDVETMYGNFDLVLGIDQVSVSVLRGGEQ